MILSGAILLGLLALWIAAAWALAFRLRINVRQAFLYAPLKLAYRIDDSQIRASSKAGAPVIYIVWHKSKLDPALMLSLLPDQTIHILDEQSANSIWLEPWRELARTITFNANHVFVSRRLVRVLKGKGRLAVYLPDEIEPDTKAFRLVRAIASIAVQADAKVVPVVVANGHYLFASLTPKARAPRRLLPRLSVAALPPATIAELVEAAGGGTVTTASNALFDRLAEVRLAGASVDRSLFQAVRDAAVAFGPSRPIVEDPVGGALSYRKLLIGARVLGRRFAGSTRPGEAVGLLLPNANALVLSLLGLSSAGRLPALMNYTAGPANTASAIKAAAIRTVVSSRAFIEKAGLADIVEAVEKTGAKLVWLEDLRAGIRVPEKIAAALLWRLPLQRQHAGKPAVILFTSGSEGTPKAVVLTARALIANVKQAEARISFSPADRLLNVLPVFHSFGLTGGTVLPLISGVPLFLYPSPLHYKVIPDVARKWRPTIMFGTDTFLAAYARTAKDGDFSSLRFVVAGAEAVRPNTRSTWRDRFGAEIVEGYGLTEAAPVVAVNSATHNRDGTVGRLLPGMRMKVEPVEGIAEGGRLLVKGPNRMLGYMTAAHPGELQPLAGEWLDTGAIVSVDREGFITIRGRAKRFAKIAGEMISLAAVEMMVKTLWPDGGHAAVAVPDKKRGERIVLVTTAGGVDQDSLRRCGKQMGAAEIMVPAEIVRVEEIPLLGSGKTDYVAAKRLAMESLGLDLAA